MVTNQFGIPEDLLDAIRKRDRDCAYCGKQMLYPYDKARAHDSATIEHLNWDGPFDWKDALDLAHIVMCCGSCNSSRGAKLLHDWFSSSYCLERGINAETVSAAVRAYLER